MAKEVLLNINTAFQRLPSKSIIIYSRFIDFILEMKSSVQLQKGVLNFGCKHCRLTVAGVGYSAVLGPRLDVAVGRTAGTGCGTCVLVTQHIHRRPADQNTLKSDASL